MNEIIGGDTGKAVAAVSFVCPVLTCRKAFKSLRSYAGHLSRMHPDKASRKFPPHTVFHEAAVSGPVEWTPRHD